MFKILVVLAFLLSGCASMGSPDESCGTGYKRVGCDTPSDPYQRPTK